MLVIFAVSSEKSAQNVHAFVEEAKFMYGTRTHQGGKQISRNLWQ